jgi:hypothetical protein
MLILLLGVAITSLSWAVAWSEIHVLSEHSFFPLWFGYILTINGISELVNGESLLRKMGLSFLLLFVISVPFWWFFEFLNSIVQNWHYILPNPISDTEYSIRASVMFSTVVPSVLSTVFLIYGLLRSHYHVVRYSSIKIRLRWLVLSMGLGGASFVLLAIIPSVAFPLVWIAPILLMEPILYSLNYPSLLQKAGQGEWLLPVAIGVGTIFNGFWWELWNVYSLPKWVYTIPHLDFWKVFEMPILGYLGYPFFGIIVYSYTMFVLFGVLVACWPSCRMNSFARSSCFPAPDAARSWPPHGC